MKDDVTKATQATKYKKKIEDELTDLCNTVLNLLDEYLIPNASEDESKVRKNIGHGVLSLFGKATL